MPMERTPKSTISILHALPNIAAGERVDIYANSSLLATDLSPGDLVTKRVKPGDYRLDVFSTEQTPSTASPLMTIDSVALDAGSNHTVALHLGPTMASTISTFLNETRTVGRDMGRLTVRNIAQGPTLDVRSRGSVLMSALRSGTEKSVGLPTGDYRVRIVRADTRRDLLPPSMHPVVNEPGRQDMGDNRIVYVWGSAADGSLKMAVQEIPLVLN